MKTNDECDASTELDENFKLKEYIKQGIFFTGLPILYFTTTICIIKKLRWWEKVLNNFYKIYY